MDQVGKFKAGAKILPLWYDLRISNNCNLSCIMCGPQLSSRWAKELNIKDVSDRARKTKNKIVESLDLGKLRRIHFNGGEPLINNDHVDLLEKISDLSKVKISYNTNGTVYPTDNTIKLWEKAHCVRLFFSIDAIGKAFDYIRWPANWQQIQDNILKMKNNLPSNVMFGLNVTVGSYNLLEISDLYDWYLDTIAQNREGDASDFNWQPAQGFFPKYLDQNIKKDSLAKLKIYNQLNSLYNFIKQDLDILPNNKWMHNLNTIDSRRNTNWQQSLKIGNYYQ
jgi:MoaA/NifB/PqqE/SkfB family radical SAM enzyme